MKAHSLLILCILAMLAVGCTTKQSYITDDNPLGYNRQDIIEYLEDFTTADLIRLRARKNQSVTPTGINSLLCRWRKTGRIDKTYDTHWHQLT